MKSLFFALATALTIGVDAIEITPGPLANVPAFNVQKLNQGTGPVCPSNAHVKVHYTGKFANGTVFDSSAYAGKPLDFVVGAG